MPQTPLIRHAFTDGEDAIRGGPTETRTRLSTKVAQFPKPAVHAVSAAYGVRRLTLRTSATSADADGIMRRVVDVDASRC